MNEIFDDKMLERADGLRKALERHEERLPKLSIDINERLMNQMSQAKPKTQSARLWWIWGVAASIAILMLTVAVWTLQQSDELLASVDVENRKQFVSGKSHHPKKEALAPKESVCVLPRVGVKKDAEKITSKEEWKRNAKEENIISEQAIELTDEQKKMTHYIAQLTQICQADSLPIACGNVDGNMVYVFPDNEEYDVMGRLSMVALWLDADKPNVKLVFSSDQMTLELMGEHKANSVNDIWLADKRDGLVCLYHAQSRQEEQNWSSASCYMDFLAVNNPGRSGRKYKENY